jgi:hypothetical protein
MSKRLGLPLLVVTALVTLFGLGSAIAQQREEYPLLDKVAQKIIDKYNTSSCSQLVEARAAKASGQKPAGERGEMEQRVVEMLRKDPAKRQYFLNKVAGPIANKMFECEMIP